MGTGCHQHTFIRLTNGEWAIEDWNGGLNFWRPWNTWNYGNYKMFIDDMGYVGINMRPMSWYSQTTGWWWWQSTISNFRLQVKGNIVSHGHYTWSGLNMKKNITEIESGIEDIMKLKPVSYNYDFNYKLGGSTPTSDNDAVKNATIQAELNVTPPTENEPKHFGFIAEDVAEIFPNIISHMDSFEAVNYTELTPILVKGIQEQQKVIEKLQAEINSLNDLVKSLNEESKNEKGVDATLGQNRPNPFNNSTTISYEILSTFNSAKIIVYDFWGVEKFTHDIFSTGQGTFTIQAQTLESGTYHYIMIIDDFVVDSKIMFLIK